MTRYFQTDGIVKPEWIDFNGHMNVGYYGVALDLAGDPFFDHLGIGSAYRAATNNSFFTIESHLTYQDELLADERYTVRYRLIDCAPKAVHFFGRMLKGDDKTGALKTAATVEWLHLHVDMETRRPSALDPALLARLNQILEQHAADPVPLEVGRIMAIHRK